jgi:dynein heavy chain
LQNQEVVVAPPIKEATKLLTALIKNVAESGKAFVRWMDGTCIIMPDQRPKGEDGEPLVMTFSTEVVRMPQVSSRRLCWQEDHVHSVAVCQCWERHTQRACGHVCHPPSACPLHLTRPEFNL